MGAATSEQKTLILAKGNGHHSWLRCSHTREFLSTFEQIDGCWNTIWLFVQYICFRGKAFYRKNECTNHVLFHLVRHSNNGIMGILAHIE